MITIIIPKMMIWIINDNNNNNSNNNNMISQGYVWDVADIVAYISLYKVAWGKFQL